MVSSAPTIVPDNMVETTFQQMMELVLGDKIDKPMSRASTVKIANGMLVANDRLVANELLNLEDQLEDQLDRPAGS